MQERSSAPPFTHILLFIVIAVLALVVYPWARMKFFPPAPIPVAANGPAVDDKKDEKKGDEAAAEKPVKPGPDKKDEKSGEKKDDKVAEPKGTGKAPDRP